MRSRKVLQVLLLLAVSTAFAAGLVELLLLRFESGDVYPPYSSLRSDALGTKAFFEALRLVGGLGVERSHRIAGGTPPGKGATLFYLGVTADSIGSIDESDLLEIEARAREGGRVVVSFLPVSRRPAWERQREIAQRRALQARDERAPAAQKDRTPGSQGGLAPGMRE